LSPSCKRIKRSRCLFEATGKLAYFLTNKAVLQQSPILHWEYANEYMRLFDMDPNSGKNYHDVQASFTRIAYMDIVVEVIRPEGKTADHWKCPLIDHAQMVADINEEGNWKPSQSVAAMLTAQQSVAFGLWFFTELQENPVPIPIELILGAGKKYRLLDYMIFLYWRAWPGKPPASFPGAISRTNSTKRTATRGAGRRTSKKFTTS